MASSSQAYLLVDANVLIDYVASDISILTLATRHLGQVYVVSTVVGEVDGLSEADCDRLEIEVIEPELAQLTSAAMKRGSLSTADHLCLIIARTHGWTCVTNDGALRKACVDGGVRILWGLEVMTELVRLSALRAEDAVAVAEAIHASNPFHIPESLVQRFADGVRSVDTSRR